MNTVLIDAPTDGSDVTQIILDQIAAVPDGSTIHIEPGRYRCDRSLRLEGRHNLTIEGPADDAYDTPEPAVFWTDLKVNRTDHPWAFVQNPAVPTSYGVNSQRQHVVLSNCTGITLRNLHVQGPNDYRNTKGYTRITPPYEAEHGFFLPGSDDILIEDCSTDSTYGDGLFLGAGATHTKGPSNVTARNLLVRSPGRTGVGMTRCDHILLDGVDVGLTGTGGLSFEPNGPLEYAHDVEIQNCRIDSWLPPIPCQGVRPVHDIWIHDNTFVSSGNASSWPLVRCAPLSTDPTLRSSGVTIERNHLDYYATGGAVNIEETDGVVIRDNTFGQLGKFRVGVIAKNCTGVEIVGNDFGQCLGLMETVATPTPVHCGNRWASASTTPQNDGTC